MAYEYPLLDENLLTDSFYLNSMSMFLRGSWGMEDRCKMYVAILQNLNECSQNLFDRLNIFYYKSNSDNYFSKNKPDDMTMTEYQNSTSDYWLDMVGDILGIKRNVVVDISVLDENAEESNYQNIYLSNFEFLVYIEATIAKNTFDGSLETLRKIYTGSSLYNASSYVTSNIYNDQTSKYYDSIYTPSFLSKLNIVYRTLHTEPNSSSQERLCCEINALGDENFTTDNLKYLFYNDFLTIESVGITYTKEITGKILGAQFEADAPDAIPPSSFEDDNTAPYYVYQ